MCVFQGMREITSFGGWRAYCESREREKQRGGEQATAKSAGVSVSDCESCEAPAFTDVMTNGDLQGCTRMKLTARAWACIQAASCAVVRQLPLRRLAIPSQAKPSQGTCWPSPSPCVRAWLSRVCECLGVRLGPSDSTQLPRVFSLPALHPATQHATLCFLHGRRHGMRLISLWQCAAHRWLKVLFVRHRPPRS